MITALNKCYILFRCIVFLLCSLYLDINLNAELKLSNYEKRQLTCHFKDTLIIGASISSGHPNALLKPVDEYMSVNYSQRVGYVKPAGQIISEQFGHTVVDNLARNRTRGIKQVKELEEYLDKNKDKDISAIVALDLFFWDTVRARFKFQCEEVITSIKKVVKLAEDRGSLLILSTLPVRLISGTCTSKINRAIKSNCRESKNCIFKMASRFMKKLLRDGQVTYDGVVYTKKDLLKFDQMHYTNTAQKLFAERIIAQVIKDKPLCTPKYSPFPQLEQASLSTQ